MTLAADRLSIESDRFASETRWKPRSRSSRDGDGFDTPVFLWSL
ncbi:hypothetical protein [Methylosinus sporium]